MQKKRIKAAFPIYIIRWNPHDTKTILTANVQRATPVENRLETLNNILKNLEHIQAQYTCKTVELEKVKTIN